MLTPEQVLALAPDPASAKSGQGLATKRKWLTTGRHAGVALWGECQGSGSTPYQTTVDLAEPAFKCTCPSRKFPCKHGIGLLLLHAVDPTAFVDTQPPSWVTAWLESRAARAEKQAAKKAEQADKPVDLAAQAKRVAQREDRIQSGLDDIDQWLRDLIRRGLANLNSTPGGEGRGGAGLTYKFFDNAAARLVDSQAPGLARMVRDMSGIPASGPGWQDRLVERAALLHLAVQGYRHLDTLPPDAQADLRTVIGWTIPQEDVLAGPGVDDTWYVLAQHVEEDDRLLTQRTWLRGLTTHRDALILRFAHGAQGLPADNSLVPGTTIDATLAYFLSALPLRALIKENRNADTSDSGAMPAAMGGHVLTPGAMPVALDRHAVPPPTQTTTQTPDPSDRPSRFGEEGDQAPAQVGRRGPIATALDTYARAIAKLPWLDRYPLTLVDVIPTTGAMPAALGGHAGSGRGVGSGSEWRLVDTHGHTLPITPRFQHGYRLLALSGGHPITITGEWNGTHFLPLAAIVDRVDGPTYTALT